MARFRLARPAQIDLANILATSTERWGAEGRQLYAALMVAAMRQVAAEPEGVLTDMLEALLKPHASGDRFTFSTIASPRKA
jgi:plasmid stabilization system protein ParE